MKKVSIPACILCFLALFPLSASADFSGPYGVSNWTPILTLEGGFEVGPGSYDVSLAPASISITSADFVDGDFFSDQDFTIAANGNGIVSFAWSFLTMDVDGPFYDPFGYLLNGVFNQLTDDDGLDAQMGSHSFVVGNGDVFGFRAHSFDSTLGSATTTISQFNFAPVTAPVPEPGTIILLGSGIIGLVAWRRKKFC